MAHGISALRSGIRRMVECGTRAKSRLRPAGVRSLAVAPAVSRYFLLPYMLLCFIAARWFRVPIDGAGALACLRSQQGGVERVAGESP
jgi:hypothetical protein